MIALVLFVLVTLLFFVLSWRGTVSFEWKSFRYLRIFFPSWRFFESANPIVIVYFRFCGESLEEPPWVELPSVKFQRYWFQLFFNAELNLDHTYAVQIEQLLIDLGSHGIEEIESLASYKIVSSYIRQRLGELHSNKSMNFQFKIGVEEFENSSYGLKMDHKVVSDVFCSSVMEL